MALRRTRQLARLAARTALRYGPRRLRKLAVRVPFSRFSHAASFAFWGDDEVEWEGCRVMANAGETHGYYLSLLGQYAVEEIAALDGACAGARVFADVGANHGLVSLALARRRPELMIHAFEPEPAAMSRLRRNLALNPGVSRHISAHPLAVCDAVGTARFKSAAGTRNPEVGSLSHAADPGASTIEVRTTSLDAFFAEHEGMPDVIKIDVEGAELQVLEGMPRILRDTPPKTLLIEVHSFAFGADNRRTQDALRQILVDAGYELRMRGSGQWVEDQPVGPWPARYHLLARLGA